MKKICKVGQFIFTVFHYFLNFKNVRLPTQNRIWIMLVSWDQRYLNSSKEFLALFHQKLPFDLSKYMAVDIMKILCKKTSCGPQILHNYRQYNLYPVRETIYLLQGPTYSSESILQRNDFPSIILDIIRNQGFFCNINHKNSFAKSYDKRICNFTKHQRQKSLILTTNSTKAAITPAKINLFSNEKNQDFKTYTSSS